MRQEARAIRLCANGCGRPSAVGEPFCETCAIEWTLYRRDTRSAFAEATADPDPARPAAGESPRTLDRMIR